MKALTSIIRTGLRILMGLIDLVNSIIISNDLIQMVNFPTRIIGCDSHSPAPLDLFISSEAIICLKYLLKDILNIKIKNFKIKTLRTGQISNRM